MKRASMLMLLIGLSLSSSVIFAQKDGVKKHDNHIRSRYVDFVVRSNKKVKTKKQKHESSAPAKFTLNKGDAQLMIGGSAKIEHYFNENACLLNSSLPDTLEYFKHTIHLDFNYVGGKKKFGYNALEAFLRFRYKGFWGLSQNYSDRGSMTVDPSTIKIADAITGGHSHSTGRSLPWVHEAWVNYVFNAAFGCKEQSNLHSIKLGWFPFALGRGIALGDSYGTNREYLGVYRYGSEDKYLPGINIHGDLLKNVLSYDLYFARMQEFNKSLSNTLDLVRTNWVFADQNKIPWRGSGKDSDIFAARMKWKAIDNARCGKLNLEPYIFYNVNDDAFVEFEPDASMKFGSYGLNAEYAWKNFEVGAEIAANYGKEKVVAYDRNQIILKNDPADDGNVKQYYSHITQVVGGASVQANVTTAAKAFAKNPAYRVNGQGDGTYTNGGLAPGVVDYNVPTKANRFRPAFQNDLRGWMFVLDAAYNLPEYNLKFAAAYNFASGDANPNEDERNKTFKGFVGLNEWYIGKRVPSIFLMNQRLLKSTTPLTRNSDELESDLSFSDMHIAGLGMTWSPMVGGKKLQVNPNSLFFFRDKASKKVLLTGAGAHDWEASSDNASKFMGTELNLTAKCEVLSGLSLFGNFAVFIPGGYFKDISGVPLNGDFFEKVQKFGVTNPKEYRMGNDTAYHMNLGLDFRF